jgi:hypothetical protein
MARPRATTVPAERLDRYDRLIATIPGLERKGASIPYTSVNGHMSSYLTESGSLVLRLSGPDRGRFIAEHATRLHEAYGIVQKEFVDVPDDLFTAADRVAPWFAASYAWVAGQKPRATRRSG